MVSVGSDRSASARGIDLGWGLTKSVRWLASKWPWCGEIVAIKGGIAGGDHSHDEGLKTSAMEGASNLGGQPRWRCLAIDRKHHKRHRHGWNPNQNCLTGGQHGGAGVGAWPRSIVYRKLVKAVMVWRQPKVVTTLRVKIPSNVGEIPIKWEGMLRLTWHAQIWLRGIIGSSSDLWTKWSPSRAYAHIYAWKARISTNKSRN